MYRLVPMSSTSSFEVTSSTIDSLTVGRAKQNDVVTQDHLVSSSHARFVIREGHLYLVDLDSRNGTELNGRRLKAFDLTQLSRGDLVQFAGRLSFRVEVQSEAAFPVISVEHHQQEPAAEDILKVLALPSGLTPVLEAGQLLALHKLTDRLLDPQNLQNGSRWLETLTIGAARLLKVPEVALLKLEGDSFSWVSPPFAASSAASAGTRGGSQRANSVPGGERNPIRRSVIQECVRRGSAVAVELADLAVEADATLEGGTGVAAALCAVVSVGEQAWGLLYATDEAFGTSRAFSEQDVWLLNELSKTVGRLLEWVSVSQIVENHRAHYERLIHQVERFGVVGISPALGNAVEVLARYSVEAGSLLLVSGSLDTGRRWAELARALGPRDGAPFGAATLPGAALRQLLPGLEGGTLLLEGLDQLDEDDAKDLFEVMHLPVAQRVRWIVSSRLSPSVLTHERGLSPALVELLSNRVIRIPSLRERNEDIPCLLEHVARRLEPATPTHFSTETLAALGGFDYPNEETGLESVVKALLSTASERPVELQTLEELQVALQLTRGPAPPAIPTVTREAFHAFSASGHDVALSPFSAAFAAAGLFRKR